MTKNIFLLLFFISCNIYPQQNVYLNLHSPQNIKKFADYLYCNEDYLRAANEYDNYSNYIKDDTINYKAALCYLNIGNYAEANARFGGLYASSFSEQSKLQSLRCSFMSENYSEVMNTVNRQQDFTIKYSQEYNRFALFSYLKSVESYPFNEIWLNSIPDEQQSAIKKFLDRKQNPDYKSPLLASIFSTLLPGSGKIYTERYEDGITAFIITGLFAYLGYDNFHSKHYFSGWLFSGLGFLFYAGNVYGSAASAQIYNAKVDFQFNADLDSFFRQNDYFLPKEIGFECR
jgi:TM2 domain-containing membrane protein YozV